MYQTPLVIEKQGKKLIVLSFTDIDGTVNDQSVPERERLNTIDPAKDAIKMLQKHNIFVGFITARSIGETKVYQDAFNVQGISICEDGAVIILPKHKKLITTKYSLVDHDSMSTILLSKITTKKIKEFLENIQKEYLNHKMTNKILTTCTSSPQEIYQAVNYATIADATRAMDRLASAFVRNATEEQATIIRENSQLWGVRTFGPTEHVQLIGSDVNKGTTLQWINDNIKTLFPDLNHIDGMLPIVFGNDTNDIPLFEQAHALDGYAILVKNSQGEYNIPNNLIKSFMIKANAPYGFGIKESLPLILNNLKTL